MSRDVFICHASQDRDAAEATCAAIEQRGLACWLPSRDLGAGQDARDAAALAIARCRLAVLIVSAASADEPNLGRDAEAAASEGKPLIALRLADPGAEGALGRALAVAYQVDALTPPLSVHLDYLADHVVHELEHSRPLQPTLPPRPLPPRRARAHYWLPVAGAGLAGLVAVAAVAMYVARPHPVEAAK